MLSLWKTCVKSSSVTCLNETNSGQSFCFLSIFSHIQALILKHYVMHYIISLFVYNPAFNKGRRIGLLKVTQNGFMTIPFLLRVNLDMFKLPENGWKSALPNTLGLVQNWSIIERDSISIAGFFKKCDFIHIGKNRISTVR